MTQATRDRVVVDGAPAQAVIDVPNPIRPSAFQRWLAASAVGMLVGMPTAILVVYLLPASLPPGAGWPIMLIPIAGVLAAYGLLRRVWPDRVTLGLQDGQITGAAKGRTLPAGRGLVSVRGDYGRTARGIRYDVYTIRYLSGDAGTASVTLRAGCTDPVRVRDFAEALCRLGAYGLRWQAPGAREHEERHPEDVGRSISGLTAAPAAPLTPVPVPSAPRTRLELLEDGTLRVRTGGPRPSTVLRIGFWFLVVAGATAVLELRSPGGWAAILTGAIALLLGLLLLVAGADSVLRHEYHLGTDGARGRTSLFGVSFQRWFVPASAINSFKIREDSGEIVVAGRGFRHRIRLGLLPRPGELRWVAQRAEVAITGRPSSGDNGSAGYD